MAKQDKIAKAQNAQRDDALFEALGKSKRNKKRKIIITAVLIVLILAVATTVGVNLLQRKVREQFASSTGEVLSYTASTGSISTVVSGSGTLTDVDLESITVPDGVEITEVLVKTNDTIAEGDVLATVNMASVKSTMADLQTQIESLDEQISDAETDEVSETIRAGVSGRIKAIFAAENTEVADTMYEYGALALLSLDGYMALDVETNALSVGDSVIVVLSDGKEISGSVETVSGGTATILVTDNGPAYDEEASVLDSAGNLIGTGTLYIHNALRITGYAGTVSAVRIGLNDKVTASTRLFTLKDTNSSTNYDSLLRSRSELENTLLELLTIQKNGAVLAPISGSVYSVDYEENGTSVATLSPDASMSVTINVDESDILSLELGQNVTVSVSSVSEDTFEGTLTEINKTASNGYYSAVITVDKTEGMLSGMTANVSVRIEGVDDAILIPVEALHQTSTGAYVYTSYDEENQEYGGKVDVVTGLQNSSYVEIKSGLSVGDTVYYTESSSINNPFGGMSNMSGGDFSGGNFGGDFSGGGFDGEAPEFNGEMPDFSGGNRGGMPGGSNGFGG